MSGRRSDMNWINTVESSTSQWSLCKTETVETLARQAEIGVWVQAQGGGVLADVRGITPEKC